jgi:hypothetical protein
MSGSVKSPSRVVGPFPRDGLQEDRIGQEKLVCLANFEAGMALPRATPAMSADDAFHLVEADSR